MGTGELLGKPNKLRESDLQCTSIPSRGSRNTPNCFMLQKLHKNKDKLSSYEPSLNFSCLLLSLSLGREMSESTGR